MGTLVTCNAAAAGKLLGLMKPLRAHDACRTPLGMYTGMQIDYNEYVRQNSCVAFIDQS